jgi:ABC-type protease/lipase transport system fused ATPase/permease subunit
MTPLEILVAVIAVLTLVKFVVFLVNPKHLLKMADKLFKDSTTPTILYLIIALIVGYFVFGAMNIVQVYAAMILGIMTVGLVLSAYPKNVRTLMKDMIKNKNRMWLCWLIWIVLSVWALYAIFA